MKLYHTFSTIRSTRWIRSIFINQCRAFCANRPSPDYYKILNIEKTATEKEVKAGFYEQSKLLHPDTHPEDDSAPEKFRELVEAYEVLSDQKKRKAYDQALQRPGRDFQWTPKNNQSDRKQQYGVDPRIMRNIEVDLSEERMKKAWKLYKERWKREEEKLRKLEEKKILFRLKIDERREAYATMTEEEKAIFKENMRLFRHPDFMEKPLHSANKSSSTSNDKNPYENIYEDMKKPNPPIRDVTEDSEEVQREIQRRIKEDPDFRSHLEFWEGLANKARNGPDPMLYNHGNTTKQAKSNTGRFFEEVSQRGQNLGNQWKERQSEGYVETPESVSDTKVPKSLVLFMALFVLSAFGGNWYLDQQNDGSENNVYLKQLKEQEQSTKREA